MAGPEKTRLISCRCTYCGAPIEVAFGQKTATCPYCDTTFFVEQGKDANSSFREDDDSVRDYEYGTGNYKKDTADPFVEIVQTAVGYMENRAAAREKKEADKRDLKRIKAERKLNRKEAAREYRESSPEERKKLKAEAREEARLEREARMTEILGQAQIAYEQRRIRELEAMERARIQEEEAAERKRKIWRGVGQFFLWIYFFPIMLAVVLFKRKSENKENSRLMSKGLEPKNVTPIPIVFAIIGGFFFISVTGNLIEASINTDSATTNGNISASVATASDNPKSTMAPIAEAEPTATIVPTTVASVTTTITPLVTPKPTLGPAPTINPIAPVTPQPETMEALSATPGIIWYEQEYIDISQKEFSEESVTEKNGVFQYKIPKSWIKRKLASIVKYHTVTGVFSTYLTVGSYETFNEGEMDYDQLDVNSTYDYISMYFQSFLEDENISNAKAYPSELNGRYIGILKADYNKGDAHGESWCFVIPDERYSLVVTALMANGDKNMNMNDVYAMLSSVDIVEE